MMELCFTFKKEHCTKNIKYIQNILTRIVVLKVLGNWKMGIM